MYQTFCKLQMLIHLSTANGFLNQLAESADKRLVLEKTVQWIANHIRRSKTLIEILENKVNKISGEIIFTSNAHGQSFRF